MIRRVSSVLSFLLFACARNAPAPPSADNTVLPSTDWRRSLVGDWIVEFRLDSVRVREGSATRWRPASFATATGTLRLSDSTAGSKQGLLRSRLQIQFDSLLGRPMSCFDPPSTATDVEREGDSVTLRFTPTAADCGFSAYGKLAVDSLVGSWDETSFVGPTVMGRFRMIRIKR